jgi:predicted secreted hydrolase
MRILALFLTALPLFGGDEPFQIARPGYEFAFPRDHGNHPGFRTEWWYFTGHLFTNAERRYGFEVTFFRVGVAVAGEAESRWDLQDVMPAHFAITDIEAEEFRYYEKLNRASPFTAASAAGKMDVFNESWRAFTQADGSWRLIAAAGEDSLDLVLRAQKPPAIHGREGVSIKAPAEGHASHYYSMTRLAVGGMVNGVRCSGTAWMDHEFGSAVLRENQQGWDWFSIQLDNDTELMLYVIRRRDGTADVTSSGSLVTSEGRVIHLTRDQMQIEVLDRWKSPKSGAVYPVRWRIHVPAFGIALLLEPVLRNQELITAGSTDVTYWEGAVDASGSFRGTVVRGRGYVEMTGYDRAFRIEN